MEAIKGTCQLFLAPAPLWPGKQGAMDDAGCLHLLAQHRLDGIALQRHDLPSRVHAVCHRASLPPSVCG
jgi:hypothetical protein